MGTSLEQILSLFCECTCFKYFLLCTCTNFNAAAQLYNQHLLQHKLCKATSSCEDRHFCYIITSRLPPPPSLPFLLLFVNPPLHSFPPLSLHPFIVSFLQFVPLLSSFLPRSLPLSPSPPAGSNRLAQSDAMVVIGCPLPQIRSQLAPGVRWRFTHNPLLRPTHTPPSPPHGSGADSGERVEDRFRD